MTGPGCLRPEVDEIPLRGTRPAFLQTQQQPEGERGRLTGIRGRGAPGTKQPLGDDRILMRAEQFLNLLGQPGERHRVRAEYRCGRLGRVPQTLRLLAGTVQLEVPLVAGRSGQRGLDLAGQPTVRASDQLRDGGARGLRRRATQRSGDHRPQISNECQVPLAAQHRHGLGASLGLACEQLAVDRLADRATHQLGGQGGHPPVEVLDHHLAVAGRGQRTGQIAQLAVQVAGGRRVEHRREGTQRAAEPTGRHPHLVYGIGGIQANPWIGGEQGLHLGCKVGPDNLTGWRLQPRPGPGRRRVGVPLVRQCRPEHPRQLGRVRGLGCTGRGQGCADRVQQAVLTGADTFDLDLAPLAAPLAHGVPAKGLGTDVIVDDLREISAGGVAKADGGAGRDQPRNRSKRCAAQVDTHQVNQLVGRSAVRPTIVWTSGGGSSGGHFRYWINHDRRPVGTADRLLGSLSDIRPFCAISRIHDIRGRLERTLDLVPFTDFDRQLQVPTVVVPAGTPSKCDLVIGQPKVVGVVIDRLQGDRFRFGNSGDALQLVQRGKHKDRLDHELAFDFPQFTAHAVPSHHIRPDRHHLAPAPPCHLPTPATHQATKRPLLFNVC